jgi:hypothetical protein
LRSNSTDPPSQTVECLGPLTIRQAHQALQQPDDAARAAFLDQACANQPELRARIEKLLQAHDAPVGLFDKPAAEAGATSDEVAPGHWINPADLLPPSEGPGSRIGPYKLLQKVGEGGMGIVFMAEQEQPVRRKVALKIIKPGMDSAQVIARFEAERQALALMDHQSIARVLDAGTTQSGRPYFVMELVKGVPITKFCDDNHLTPRERLELFMPVCQAIQHAHQKGLTPGVGRFYALVHDFSPPSADYLWLSFASHRAAKQGPKSHRLPDAVAALGRKLSSPRPRRGDHEFTTPVREMPHAPRQDPTRWGRVHQALLPRSSKPGIGPSKPHKDEALKRLPHLRDGWPRLPAASLRSGEHPISSKPRAGRARLVDRQREPHPQRGDDRCAASAWLRQVAAPLPAPARSQ